MFIYIRNCSIIRMGTCFFHYSYQYR